MPTAPILRSAIRRQYLTKNRLSVRIVAGIVAIEVIVDPLAVLILGSEGYIGSALAAFLRARLGGRGH